MAYANVSRTAAGTLTDRLGAIANTLRLAIARRQKYNLTRRELYALTERELSDLGIHRSMIDEIAHEAAYGK